jgi:hypothetical protein
MSIKKGGNKLLTHCDRWGKENVDQKKQQTNNKAPIMARTNFVRRKFLGREE